jgi:hypothetical protein
VLWFSGVLAAPIFEAKDEALVALAGRFWDEATTCSGWEAEHHATVGIERVVGLPMNGRAWNDSKGLYKIELDHDAGAWTLAHEVAHAWHHQDQHTLSEGLAEVLAECIAEGLPEDLPRYGKTALSLSGMPDLTHDWSYDDPRVREAYLGSAALFRVLAAERGRDFVLGHPWTLQTLEKELRDTPLNVLSLEVADQTRALADPDGDGIVTLQEHLAGTDPHTWNNLDGSWGGPAAPPNAVMLPEDGSGMCLNEFIDLPAPDKGWTISFTDPTVRKVIFDGRRVRVEDIKAEPWDSFRLAPGETGWLEHLARPSGRNPYCVSDDSLTLRAEAPSDRNEFWALGGRIQEFITEATERWGARTRLEAVLERGDFMHMVTNHDVVRFDISLPLTRFKEARDPSVLAATTVAWHWLYTSDDKSLHDRGAAAALGIHLAGKKPLNSVVDSDKSAIKRWQKYADSAGGWDALLAD